MQYNKQHCSRWQYHFTTMNTKIGFSITDFRVNCCSLCKDEIDRHKFSTKQICDHIRARGLWSERVILGQQWIGLIQSYQSPISLYKELRMNGNGKILDPRKLKGFSDAFISFLAADRFTRGVDIYQALGLATAMFFFSFLMRVYDHLKNQLFPRQVKSLPPSRTW